MTRKHISGVLTAAALTLAAVTLAANAQTATQPPPIKDDAGTVPSKPGSPAPGSSNAPSNMAPAPSTAETTSPAPGAASQDSQMTKQANPGPAGRTPEEPQPNSPAVK